MTVSVEFFPPRTLEGVVNLKLVTEKLISALHPDFFSVTFGAGGSAQDGTLKIIKEMHKEGLGVAPHLSCINNTKSEIFDILEIYQKLGISRIVAIRGDSSSNTNKKRNDFHYANQLVNFIREIAGNQFQIAVAAYTEMHPEAKCPNEDILHFINKIRSGADFGITQYFFNCDSYFRFIEDIAKYQIQIPVIPGIMPIVNSNQLLKFSDICGAEIPRWIRFRLQSYANDIESVKAFGIEIVSNLCERLISFGVPGLHFYSLNQADIILEIAKNLSLDNTTFGN